MSAVLVAVIAVKYALGTNVKISSVPANKGNTVFELLPEPVGITQLVPAVAASAA